MRLRREKIDDLSFKILSELKKNPDVVIRGKEENVLHEIKNIITMDLEREDKLEDEVRDLLQKHMKQIYRDDISYIELVRKAKKQLARERGLVL
jgi:hypothetical protein